jgi:hypothetical protein
LKEPAARANDGVGTTSSALIQVTSCTGYVMYLFDQPGYTGNEICFVGDGASDLSGPIDLSQYHRVVCGNYGCWFGANWAGAVRSFYTALGGDFSSLGDWYIGGDGLWHRVQNVEYFQPYSFEGSVDATVQAATSMNLFP